MSLQARIASLLTSVGTDTKAFRIALLGSSATSLSGLQTTAKTSLIAAINEARTGGTLPKIDQQVYIGPANAVWKKPTGGQRFCKIQMYSGGQSGYAGSLGLVSSPTDILGGAGGAGGSYSEITVLLAQLSDTVNVTAGYGRSGTPGVSGTTPNGGTANATGDLSTFGAFQSTQNSPNQLAKNDFLLQATGPNDSFGTGGKGTYVGISGGAPSSTASPSLTMAAPGGGGGASNSPSSTPANSMRVYPGNGGDFTLTGLSGGDYSTSLSGGKNSPFLGYAGSGGSGGYNSDIFNNLGSAGAGSGSNGFAGGFPGGGGGGGGAGRTDGVTAQKGGDGGAGAAGIVIVTCW